MATEVNNSKGEAEKVEQLYKEQDELLGMEVEVFLGELKQIVLSKCNAKLTTLTFSFQLVYLMANMEVKWNFIWSHSSMPFWIVSKGLVLLSTSGQMRVCYFSTL